MYSWSTEELTLQSTNPKQYQIWKQIQLINYGLNEEKLDRKLLVSNWDVIKDQLDPLKASVIEYWLWGTQPSFPNYKNGSWSWS
ncbi:hypothetical protein HZB69_00285 [Candidatus Amesbacteria bacterium]|nr:hypothetical protein [Candidatus Amesbacteria bacterium]